MQQPIRAPKFLIVKTGDAIESVRRRFGDFEDWFVHALGTQTFRYEVCRVHEDERLPPSDRMGHYAGVVVTGSPAMVSGRADWSERTARWLADIHASVPILGVCYGHQLLAHAFGGRVGPNPAGRRMGMCRLEIDDGRDPLIGRLTSPADVHVTHVEAVLETPRGARVTGRTRADPHHVIDYGRQCHGVQFHPEFTAGIMAGYLQARQDSLEAEGFDSRALLAAVRPAPAGHRVLERFARICLERSATGVA